MSIHLRNSLTVIRQILGVSPKDLYRRPGGDQSVASLVSMGLRGFYWSTCISMTSVYVSRSLPRSNCSSVVKAGPDEQSVTVVDIDMRPAEEFHPAQCQCREHIPALP